MLVEIDFEPDTVAFFTHGWCAPLAVALHDLTGWDFVLIRPAVPFEQQVLANDVWTTRSSRWGHAAVCSPDGLLLLDITGLRPAEDVCAYWDGQRPELAPYTAGWNHNVRYGWVEGGRPVVSDRTFVPLYSDLFAKEMS